MDGKRIIMNFTVPPGAEDLEVMALAVLEVLPEELSPFCEDIVIVVEDLPDESVEAELDLEDPFELPLMYRSGKEVSPGVEKKIADKEGVLTLYRRPLLDLWCEGGDDLSSLLRQVIVEELGRYFDFSDDEIDEMSQRHYQGML